jgi:hypothetical protein
MTDPNTDDDYVDIFANQVSLARHNGKIAAEKEAQSPKNHNLTFYDLTMFLGMLLLAISGCGMCYYIAIGQFR